MDVSIEEEYHPSTMENTMVEILKQIDQYREPKEKYCIRRGPKSQITIVREEPIIHPDLGNTLHWLRYTRFPQNIDKDLFWQIATDEPLKESIEYLKNDDYCESAEPRLILTKDVPNFIIQKMSASTSSYRPSRRQPIRKKTFSETDLKYNIPVIMSMHSVDEEQLFNYFKQYVINDLNGRR